MEALEREKVDARNSVDPNPSQKMTEPDRRAPQELSDRSNGSRKRRRFEPRAVPASHRFTAEPERITDTVVVRCEECGRDHVHYIRRAGDVTSVVRKPHCKGPRYRIVLPSPRKAVA